MSSGHVRKQAGGGDRYSSTVEKGPSAWKQEWSGFITGIRMTNEGKSVKLPTCMDHEKERKSNYSYLFSTPAEKKAERERVKKDADRKGREQVRKNQLAGEAEFEGDSRSKMKRELEKAMVGGVSLQGLNRKQKRGILRLTETEEQEVEENKLQNSGASKKVHELMDLSKAWYQQNPYPLDEISEKLVIKKALKHAKQLNFKYNYMTVHPSWMAARAKRRLLEHKTVPQGETTYFDDDGNALAASDRFGCKLPQVTSVIGQQMEGNSYNGGDCVKGNDNNTSTTEPAALHEADKGAIIANRPINEDGSGTCYISPYYNHYKPYEVEEVLLMVSSAVLRAQQHHFKPEGSIIKSKPSKKEKSGKSDKEKVKKTDKRKNSLNREEEREEEVVSGNDDCDDGDSDVSLGAEDMFPVLGATAEDETEEGTSEEEEGTEGSGDSTLHDGSDGGYTNAGDSDDGDSECNPTAVTIPIPSHSTADGIKKSKNKEKVPQLPSIPDDIDIKIKTKANNIAASLARRLKKKGSKKVNIKRLQDNELRKLLGLTGSKKMKPSPDTNTSIDTTHKKDAGTKHTNMKKSAGRKATLLEAGKPLPTHFKEKRGGRVLKETRGKYVHPARAAVLRRKLRDDGASK